MKRKRLNFGVIYYVATFLLLLILFFTNDFNATDVQKSAIVIAVGVDGTSEEFSVTAQISLPNKEEQGGTQTSLITGKGSTVAEAFRDVNAKTGWYPKLVFCKLIVLGESACKENAFTALDYFLRDEYFPDGCLIAACKGEASKLLSTQTPVDKISALAAQKVLSRHAERVGAVAPMTLREFAEQFYSRGKSGVLPVLSTAPPSQSSEKSGSQQSGQNSEKQEGGQGEKQSSAQSGKTSKESEQQVFQAKTSALFLDGKAVGKLTDEETFAFCLVRNKLRLADYGIEFENVDYTLNFRYTRPSLKLKIDENGVPRLDISVKITAGLKDVNAALGVSETDGPANIPDGLFERAQTKLEEEIAKTFETCRAAKCDALELFGELERKNADYLPVFREDLLERVIVTVRVKLDSVR